MCVCENICEVEERKLKNLVSLNDKVNKNICEVVMIKQYWN